MKKTSLAACLTLLGAALLSGCAISLTTNGDGSSSKIQKSGATTKFQCVQSGTGQCNYVLFTSRCSSVEGGESGKPATTCTHQVIEQFSVASGQSREFSKLPDGYKQCMKPGAKPEVPNCD